MSTKKQISRFIIVGITAVLIDFCSYKILINYLTYSPSKTLSFILGALFAYLANKFFTFEKKNYCHKEIAKFSLLYSVTLFANVITNKISILFLSYIAKFFPDLLQVSTIVTLSFLAATGASTILNFLGQKFWVFR